MSASVNESIQLNQGGGLIAAWAAECLLAIAIREVLKKTAYFMFSSCNKETGLQETQIDLTNPLLPLGNSVAKSSQKLQPKLCLQSTQLKLKLVRYLKFI